MFDSTDASPHPAPPARTTRGWLLATTAATLTCAVALTFAIPTTATAAAPPAAVSTLSSAGAASGYGSNPYGSRSASLAIDATAATADESTGVVLIDTVLGYAQAEAAGTGMVLTSGGLVLTNNHVVAGSTRIQVTIASTGETYAATVVGTDAQDDVALLQLEGASDLATVTIDQDAESVGDAVTAVGNAMGRGELLAADGRISELETTVTTASEGNAAGETLDGMIQVAADVVSGDSGGALLDAEGEVIGMTTAASSGRSAISGWAIPIEDALAIAQQIADGEEGGGVTLGYPAFLGVGLASQTQTYGRYGTSGGARSSAGALIAGVYAGTPAAEAGLTGGDTVTAIDGAAVTDSATLSALIAGYEPGDTVTITWVDASGATQSADVTLAAGPVA
ncbi:S1C family serine protease [Microbacterium sp. SS28]|uniref:S1C family serine protease n=1 Tax=Microbacterium sp. SS28 TaxID=2919948 RepID=UPI001FAA2B8E|nr:trypsin-like peptidase domain-containing protein [Microbacterium sp. SS28]